jgi:hypothetical protein
LVFETIESFLVLISLFWCSGITFRGVTERHGTAMMLAVDLDHRRSMVWKKEVYLEFTPNIVGQ